MTAFQIVTIVISGLILFGGIIAVYVKTQVDIARINTSITFVQKDLDRKEGSICRLELDNKNDHKEIMLKIDKLIENKK